MTKNTSPSILNEGGRGIDQRPSDVQVERPETQPRARRDWPDSPSDDGWPSDIADAIPGSDPGGHVIVGAEIRLGEGSALLCDGVDMADAKDLDAALKLSRKAFQAARVKIAKRTRVATAVLKAMAGIHGNCMKLSVVIERRHLSTELMDEFEILGAEITASLRCALTFAGASLAPTPTVGSNGIPTPDAAPSSGSVEGVADPKASPTRPSLTILSCNPLTPGTSPAPVDPDDTVAMRFREGLLSIRRPGSLVVSLVTNGKAEETGAMKLDSSGRSPDPVRRRETESQQMTGFVHNFNRSGKCEFKKEGTSARMDAEFATDDIVAMHLRLACDNPAVTVQY